MTFTEESYVDDVLVPVRTGWSPHRNFFRVYRLPAHPRQADVDAALADLPARWGTPELRVHAVACERLHACHSTATAVLRDPAARARHREFVEREHQVLVEVVRHRLHGAPALTRDDVAAVVRVAGDRWSTPDVVAALDAAGAGVREPVPLPRVARPQRWPALREHLADLPHDSLWEYLSRTAELRGADTTPAEVETRRQRLRVSRDRAADAERAVLALVRLWAAAPGGLSAALAHDLLADLAAATVCGYQAVRDLASPQRCAVSLPFDPDAVAYAVWCARGEAAWTEAYFAAVDAHRLPAALDLLESRPLPESWVRVRDGLRAGLAGLRAALDQARDAEASDQEDAAARYLTIGRELTDPAVDEGLRRCPAAAPPAVVATVDGVAVVVDWQPSPSTAGNIGYRVCRGTSVLAEEATAPFVDLEAPVGLPLIYTVTALRDGVPGGTTSSEPVAVLPEVTELRVVTEPGVVFGQWRLPSGALRAVVRRTGPDSGEPADVTASETGFIDRNAEPGAAYTYRVLVEYAAARSHGVGVPVVCLREPDAVTDLLAVAAGDVVDLTWTPPHGDAVEIRLLTGPEAAPSGVVRLDQAALAGPVVATSRCGRVRVPAADLAGGRTLVPVTVSGPVATIGTPATVDISSVQVTGLGVVRLGPQVQLSWHWPAWAREVLVVWRHGGPLAGADDPAAHRWSVTRTAYLSRGARLNAPEPGSHWFGVCVLGDGQLGPLATVESPCPVQLRYRLHGRARVLAVEVECDADLPDVVVLGKEAHRPLDPDDGVVLAVVPGGQRAGRAEFTVPAELRGPVHLRAFALDDSMWVCHPDPRDLVVR